MFLEAFGVDASKTDVSLDISYKLLFYHINDELLKASGDSNIIIATKLIERYWKDLDSNLGDTIQDRHPLVKGLYFLYQTGNALNRFNENDLKISKIKFRSKVLFPYLIYILQQYLPKVRQFLQYIVWSSYEEMKKKSAGAVNFYVNSLYLDQDVIKHEVLLEFLGNAMIKFSPLDVGNVNAFYKKIFRNIFNFYFKYKQSNQPIWSNFWSIENAITSVNTSARLSVYRDVLYGLEVEKLYKDSPMLSQLGYNYKIFRNLIINNEIQDIYMSLDPCSAVGISNNEYKLLKIYDDDIMNERLIDKIRKLPTVFKLLKCIHIVNPKGKPHNEMVIKPELLKFAVRDELVHPFRNFFNDNYLLPILDKVAENFVNSLLMGDYINLITLAPIRINQISFVEQIRKFVRICLDEMSNVGGEIEDVRIRAIR